MTLVERHEPTTASVGGRRDVDVHDDVPESRKHATSEDTTIKRESKRVWSSHPSEASLVPHPHASSVAEHVGLSEERVHSPTSSGSARVRDPQRGDVPLVALVVSPQASGHGHS